MQKTMLTVQEVARIFLVCDETVRLWIAQGALEAIALPHLGTRRVYRVPRRAIENMMEAKNAEEHEI